MPAPGEPEPVIAARRALTRWLEQKRRELRPDLVGPEPLVRRRSRGVTQVDVARRAGIGRRTYQRFEQGLVRPTPEVFAAIVGALGLTAGEAAHLRALVDATQPRQPCPRTWAELADAVRPLMAGFRGPALAYDATLTVLVWNEALAGLAPSLVNDGAGPISIVRWLFDGDAASQLLVDFDTMAREAIGRLRVGRARYGDAAQFDALVADLCAMSPVARRLWDDETLLGFEPSITTYRLRHPDGTVHSVSFATMSFVDDMPPGLRLVYALSDWPPVSAVAPDPTATGSTRP
jgi:transcriptional regulator with XRE-family HTH domain